MGIDTLTGEKFLSEVERVRNDLTESGKAHVSLAEIGDRKASKRIIQIALEDVEGEVSMDFDGEENSFVVTGEVGSTSASVDADDADEDEIPF